MNYRSRRTTSFSLPIRFALVFMVSQTPLLPATAQNKGLKVPDNTLPGKPVYLEYCAGCHGMSGAGDGPAARALKPPPRNLVKDEFRFGASFEAILATVTNGIEGTPMVAWNKMLSAEQLRAVTEYVRELRTQTSSGLEYDHK